MPLLNICLHPGLAFSWHPCFLFHWEPWSVQRRTSSGPCITLSNLPTPVAKSSGSNWYMNCLCTFLPESFMFNSVFPHHSGMGLSTYTSPLFPLQMEACEGGHSRILKSHQTCLFSDAPSRPCYQWKFLYDTFSYNFQSWLNSNSSFLNLAETS